MKNLILSLTAQPSGLYNNMLFPHIMLFLVEKKAFALKNKEIAAKNHIILECLVYCFCR